MPCRRGFLTLLMLLTLGAPRLVLAQEVSATLGVTRPIKSTILGEDRKVVVHLPASYNTSGKPTRCCICWMALRHFCSR